MKNLFENLWTIPNIMSVVRLLLAPVAGFCILNDYFMWTIVAVVIAGLLDIFDGLIARKFDQVSEFGKLIDPLADKVMYAVLVISLLIKQRIPIWYVLLFISRDLIILFGSLMFSKKVQEIPQSDNLGKATIFINAIVIFLIICGVDELNGIILIIPISLLYLSTINYFWKGLKLIKKNN